MQRSSRSSSRTMWISGLTALFILNPFADGRDAPTYVKQSDAWFATPEGKTVIANILTWQMPTGGWPKEYDALTQNTRPIPHVDTEKNLSPEIRKKLAEHPVDKPSAWDWATIDNDATRSELILLARAISLSNSDEEKAPLLAGFYKGLDATLNAQYSNGGFPQRFPPPENYGKDITFNDNAMNELLELVLLPISKGEKPFAFVDQPHRDHAKADFDKGIQCILDCQVKVNGVLTVWCQQHDAVTLAPANARAYELPSLSASESANITELLMRLPTPDDRVKASIESAVAWFEASKITGKKVTATTTDGKRDRIVVDAPDAKPIWARFYDLDTGKPFFCGRDGVKKATLAEIEQERRAGYAWYGNWPQKVLDAYPKWKQQNGVK